jgi:hypothetical protein
MMKGTAAIATTHDGASIARPERRGTHDPMPSLMDGG